MKSLVSVNIILITFYASIFLNDSYLSLHQVNASLLCKCNHSSQHEIHSSNKGSLLLEDHASLILDRENLPSCHSSQIKSAHFCSCKKSSENLVNILFQKSTILEGKFDHFFVHLTSKYFVGITNKKVSLPRGFSFLITPPPKTIL